MADEDDQTQDDLSQDDEAGETGETQTSTKTFSQDVVNSIVARREKKAAKAATEALLSELGLGSADDLKKLVQEKRDREEAEKSELDKLRDEAAQARAEAQKARDEAAALNLRSAFSEALAQVLPRERVAAALKLGLPTLMTSDEDEIAGKVEAALEAVKADVPDWFQTQEDDQQKTKGGTPPPPSRTNGQRTTPPTDRALSGYERWKAKRSDATIKI